MPQPTALPRAPVFHYVSNRYACQILMTLEFSLHIFEKCLDIKFHEKSFPLGAELFHSDGQTDRHDEARSRLSQFFEGA